MLVVRAWPRPESQARMAKKKKKGFIVWTVGVWSEALLGGPRREWPSVDVPRNRAAGCLLGGNRSAKGQDLRSTAQSKQQASVPILKDIWYCPSLCETHCRYVGGDWADSLE